MRDPIHLWIRNEIKLGERRTPVTPEFSKKLLDAGFKVSVESSKARIFKDEEYERAGCELVPANSWINLPEDRNIIIIGLKELADDSFPLKNIHAYFAHCFKYQTGWRELLGRFKRGNGIIYDLEFLTDKSGRRIAAFGYTAGVCGGALGLHLWSWKNTCKEPYRISPYFQSKDELVRTIKKSLSDVPKGPKVIIIGALGRCGTGAAKILEEIGVKEVTMWDTEDTSKGGPFREILDHDIFINCIYLSGNTSPFVTADLLKSAENMRLSVIVDVSCDPNSASNTIPIYDRCTTFEDPVLDVQFGNKKVSIIAIDHLPTLLPHESSRHFSKDLFPHLLNLPQRDTDYVWSNALKIYKSNLEKLDK